MSTYTEIQPYLPAEMSSELRADYHRWCNFLDNNIVFNHSTSEIHTRLHTARVLLYSLLLVSEIMPDNDKAKEILAHASLFHDTCRFDDGLDVGHGARAAVHYKDYCERNGLSYHQEAALVMKYHDIDDKRGKVGIRKEYRDALPGMLKLYDIFKDADALDRFRLGPGGLNPKYLRTQASVRMMPLAEELVATTF